eukprot:scaffold8175_cov578-Prasinococcus_capsulatus_cf.AAC.2
MAFAAAFAAATANQVQHEDTEEEREEEEDASEDDFDSPTFASARTLARVRAAATGAPFLPAQPNSTRPQCVVVRQRSAAAECAA